MLDRSSQLRPHPDALARLKEQPDALVIPVWRDKSLIDTAGVRALPALLEMASCRTLVDQAGECVFLGTIGGRGCFAISTDPGDATPSWSELAGRGEFQDLRLAGSFLARKDAEILAYARGMLYWHRHHRFCPSCGGRTEAGEGGHVRICASCARKHFPRSDPAIMAIVVHEGRCLLARQPSFPPDMYSVLAGFVEPGEGLEAAVAREVREEVGLVVEDVRYVASQPWPFPSSLMLGFSMRSSTDRYLLDRDELESARWATREELATPAGFFVPPPYSLARQLIDRFTRGEL